MELIHAVIENDREPVKAELKTSPKEAGILYAFVTNYLYPIPRSIGNGSMSLTAKSQQFHLTFM